MGRAPCCDKTKVKRGPWSPDEDNTLKNFVEKNGTGGNWIALPQKAGLRRCGKSCRLRWLNYLRPDINHGAFTEEEDSIILTLYSQIGSRWSVIAANLQGRTDNDVKNHWNTKLKKKLLAAAEITNISSNYNSVMNHNYCATESTCFISNTLTSLVEPNLTKSSNLVPAMLNVETSCQFPLPGLMEIQENGAITTLQEDGYLMDFSSGISSTYYDILNGFDFQEKVITADPNCSSSSCSTLVQQQGYIPDIDQYPFKGVEN